MTRFIIVALTLIMLSSPLKGVVSIQADAVTRFQAITESDTSGSRTYDPTLSDPLVNLRAKGRFDAGLRAYGEIYLGQANPSGEQLELGTFYGSSGTYLTPLTIKIGQIEVPFGLQREYRSDHAQVQENPLIGNPLVDPTDHQRGLQIDLENKFFESKLALTNGTENSDLAPDRGFALGAQLNTNFNKYISSTLSLYRSQHSDSTATRGVDSPSTDNLFGADSVSDTKDIFSLQQKINTPIPTPNNVFSSNLSTFSIGRELEAWQLDINIEIPGTSILRSRYGEVQDDYSNLGWPGSNNTVRWNYHSLELKYNSQLPGFLAMRWDELESDNLASANRLGDGITSRGTVKRIEIGYGHRFSNNVLLKASYLDSDESLTGDQSDFSGVMFEFSLTGFPHLSPQNLSLSAKNQAKD